MRNRPRGCDMTGKFVFSLIVELDISAKKAEESLECGRNCRDLDVDSSMW